MELEVQLPILVSFMDGSCKLIYFAMNMLLIKLKVVTLWIRTEDLSLTSPNYNQLAKLLLRNGRKVCPQEN